MKVKLTIFTAVFFAFASFVSAQESAELIKGTDTFVYRSIGESGGCYVYEKYYVVTVPTEANGFFINVYKRTAGKSSPDALCSSKTTKPHMVLNYSDDQFFNGIVVDKVIIDSGTGPDSRGLRIVDLITKKTIYNGEVSEVGEVTEKRFVIFSEFSKVKRPIKECPKAREWRKSGFGITWVQQFKFDLQTQNKTAVGKITCAATQ